ncbi:MULTISPECIES: YafY family protein [Rhizobium]|uniref:helix-turn-helix transcriptional regulator n=1 Tax=Rhizobium TaxID=379 RepID=UPI000ACC461A|nr:MULTISPECIES: YafY family protein [Rhizobium]
MSRSHRLFDLMQVLRRHRGTVSGEVLARELGVSLRTIRRDIVTLQAMGADIDGEPGVGYLLRPGFLLPPLSLTEEEIQALVAGAQWVSRHTDDALACAVQNALAKIGGVLPPDMRQGLDDNTFFVGGAEKGSTLLDLAQVRRAMRDQRKIHITHTDQIGTVSDRTIWPIMLGFIDSKRSVAGWCELHNEFRVFQADHILAVDFLDDRYPRNRRQLVREWRAQEEHPCKKKKVEDGG